MPTKRPSRVQIRMDRSLTEVEFKLIERIEPATVSLMIRQRVHMTNASSISLVPWLKENTSGLYYQPSPSEVWFEKEDDMVLLLATFQGVQK